MNKKHNSFERGLTMIELLIVIAVIGVLAAVILLMIDPVEQLRRGRDTGRKQNVARLSRTAQAYFTTHFAWPSVDPIASPNGTNTWIDLIVNAQDLKSVPADVTFSGSGCTTAFNQNGYCFYYEHPNAFIMTQLESGQEKAKCASGEIAYFMYSSGDGKAGTVCYNTSGWDWTLGHYNFQ